ncbi:hypothetical protein [Streptomyces sp. NPDC096142]|uniref:hypothetical protein n=1 Tax=Streptomyces sp. NPDC096142 TaxID=3366077 RepID=UPI00380DB7F3
MSEATELTSQYSTQVTGDLERNLKEQERLGSELEGLEAQLTALRHDHTVLVNIQQALGIPAPAAGPAAPTPTPRKRAAGAAKQTKDKKPALANRKRAGKKSADKAPSTAPASPTLVNLVRDHLAGQSEPRSAAEITTALGEQHPGRTIKTTVVRTTLEGLVAKTQAQRTKQGSAVFYTAPAAATTAPSKQPSQQSA